MSGKNSVQANSLNTALHICDGPTENNLLDYYKNIYAAAKNYSDAKEQQTWAAWSSYGKERLVQARAMQAMIRRQLMTPEQFENTKIFLANEFQKFLDETKENKPLDKNDTSEILTMIQLTELILNERLDDARSRCMVLEENVKIGFTLGQNIWSGLLRNAIRPLIQRITDTNPPTHIKKFSLHLLIKADKMLRSVR